MGHFLRLVASRPAGASILLTSQRNPHCHAHDDEDEQDRDARDDFDLQGPPALGFRGGWFLLHPDGGITGAGGSLALLDIVVIGPPSGPLLPRSADGRVRIREAGPRRRDIRLKAFLLLARDDLRVGRRYGVLVRRVVRARSLCPADVLLLRHAVGARRLLHRPVPSFVIHGRHAHLGIGYPLGAVDQRLIAEAPAVPPVCADKSGSRDRPPPVAPVLWQAGAP